MRSWRTGAGFLAGAVASLMVAYAVSETMAPVYAHTAAALELFQARSGRVRVLGMGNSHAVAVDFGALGAPGAHLYDSGQDLFEAAHLTRYAAQRAPRLSCVLLTLSYGTERLDNSVLTSGDYRGIRRAMYLRGGQLGHLPGDHWLWVSAMAAPIVRSDHWAQVVARLGGRAPAPVALEADGKPVRAPERPRSDRAMARHARRQTAIQLARFRESVSNSPSVAARSTAQLSALAGELEREGRLLVLYTAPLHQAYLAELPGELPRQTRAALEPVLRHPNVLWVDFGAHPRFARRNDLFRDSDHLNAAGAREFSALLRSTLARRAPACVGADAGGERALRP